MNMNMMIRLILGSLVTVSLAMLTETAFAITISQIDDFESGASGWFNNAVGHVSVVQSGGPAGADDAFLQITTTGNEFGQGSRLVAIAGTQSVWQGNYTSTGVVKLTLDANNFSVGELWLRLAFNGPGGIFVTEEVRLGAASGWQDIEFELALSNMEAIGSNYESTFSNVGELRIIHREDPNDFSSNSPNSGSTVENPSGTIVVGQLGVDNITALGAPLPGDYDGNGTVGPEDYALWKTSFGSTIDLDADGNSDGIVDAGDYTIWRDQLTSMNASLSSPANTPVPEPATVCLLLTGLVGACRLVKTAANRERSPVRRCPTGWRMALVMAGVVGSFVPSAMAVDLLDTSSLTKYVDPLPNPLDNLMTPIGTLDGAPLYDLSISQFQQQLHRDLPATTVWGYNHAYPGPTFEVNQGETIKVRVTNNLVDSTGTPLQHFLPYDTTLHGAGAMLSQARIITHLHGGVVEEKSDGFPEHWYTPDANAAANGLGGPAGNNLVHTYTNDQRSTMLWYHDHAMGITRLNVYAGLAGVYIVRDAEEQSLNLPTGRYEMPLVLQDRSFYEDGQLFYPSGPGDLSSPGVGDPLEGLDDNFPSPASQVPHFIGDANLVNGVVWPLMEVEPRKYRFRILNGANSRFYNLSLTPVVGAASSENLTFYQIGTDGGLLTSRIERSDVLLAPADRTDVVVDFSQFNVGDEIILRNTGPDGMFGMQGVPGADPNTTGQVMKFRLVNSTGVDNSSLPHDLSVIDRYDANDAITTRRLTLNKSFDEHGRPELLLNGQKWTDGITEEVTQGDLEIWEFVNQTSEAHPIHLHMEQFQILERFDRRQGVVQPLGEEELGWEDTIIVNPGENVKIMVKFEQFTGTFVWHCHILEHEDLEMMRPFSVVARVPEPGTATLALFGVALLTMFGKRWRHPNHAEKQRRKQRR